MTGSGEQFDLTGPALVQASVLNVIGSSEIVLNNGAMSRANRCEHIQPYWLPDTILAIIDYT